MHRLLSALAILALSCGSEHSTPGDGDEDATLSDTQDGISGEVADPSADHPPIDPPSDRATDPDIETDPPLGICGEYCMAENRPCPEGAYCEYGAIDLMDSCTRDGCGLCAWIPEDCPPEDLPSCGCDGVIYENPCERRKLRVAPDFTWASCYADD
jgi:hypothetical protein